MRAFWKRACPKLSFASVPVKLLKWMSTCCLVTLLWILFRAESLSDALYVFSHLVPRGWGDLSSSLALSPYQLAIAGGASIALAIVETYRATGRSVLRVVGRMRMPVRLCIYQLLAFSILCFGVFGIEEFIYFQF